MKSEKGVTIVSLIIYVGVLFVVVLLVGKITGFFFKNSDTIQNPNSEADFNKLNLYMLEETKKENNRINAIGSMVETDGKWSFIKDRKTGEGEDTYYDALQFYIHEQGKDEEYNIIGQAGNGIYYNKVKICDGVKKLDVSKSTGNGKETIKIIVTFENDESYTADYTVRDENVN